MTLWSLIPLFGTVVRMISPSRPSLAFWKPSRGIPSNSHHDLHDPVEAALPMSLVPSGCIFPRPSFSSHALSFGSWVQKALCPLCTCCSLLLRSMLFDHLSLAGSLASSRFQSKHHTSRHLALTNQYKQSLLLFSIYIDH